VLKVTFSTTLSAALRVACFAASLFATGCATVELPHAPQEFHFVEPVTLCWMQGDGTEACII